MSTARIRIGIVGAGANTRDRHIPGFKLIPGVELTGVVNRSPESGNRIAQQYGIPKTYSTWQELVADPDIDAVMIGTWPNLHADVTVAALNAGKHVLTEARMARNLDEARRMHAAAKAHPDRVAMIVPSPFGLVHDTFIKELIRDDFLGDIREVVVIGADDTFRDYTKFLHWRQDREISGNNILTMGILHETVSRWIVSPSQVYAQSATFEPTRPSPDEQKQVPVTVPESVQILTRYPDGARGIYHLSGSILFGPGKQIHLYGARGTIKVEFGAEEKLYVGRAAQKELTFVELGPEKRGGWRVEEEFIAAIRGTEQVRFTDFDTGLAYMDFTEAVAQSLATNQAVALPIA